MITHPQMRVLIADSNLRDMSSVMVIVARLLLDAEILGSLDADDALSLARTHNLSPAFIDGSPNAADKMHEVSPSTHIITTPKPFTIESIAGKLQRKNKKIIRSDSRRVKYVLQR